MQKIPLPIVISKFSGRKLPFLFICSFYFHNFTRKELGILHATNRKAKMPKEIKNIQTAAVERCGPFHQCRRRLLISFSINGCFKNLGLRNTSLCLPQTFQQIIVITTRFGKPLATIYCKLFLCGIYDQKIGQ
jgi:hypothetical protein